MSDVKHNRFIALICTFFITPIRCNYIHTAIETEVAHFDFPYPCGSSQITLQYGHRLPFYSSDDPINLNADLSERFRVELIGNVIETSKCSLQLRIDPVTRDDAGTYILLANNYDYITRVGLDVDFLPGKAHCELSGRHTAQEWMKLHCIAPVGSMHGKIQCYQNGREMPPLSSPSESRRTSKYEQTILVQENSHLIYCCSSPATEIKERCKCNEFVWDPISHTNLGSVVDPCPSTTSATYVTSPTILETKSTTSTRKVSAASGVGLSANQNTKINYPLTFVLIICVFITVMSSFIARALYLKRSKLFLREKTNEPLL